MSFLTIFILLSLVNVIFSTFRSLATINSGKWVASLVNAGYFSFYNVMLIYTVADFPLWEKCAVTFGCNLIGVFLVKLIEEKSRKDKLWKVEATIYSTQKSKVAAELTAAGLSFNHLDGVGKYTIFNVFCATQTESLKVKEILNANNAKYFVSETKNL